MLRGEWNCGRTDSANVCLEMLSMRTNRIRHAGNIAIEDKICSDLLYCYTDRLYYGFLQPYKPGVLAQSTILYISLTLIFSLSVCLLCSIFLWIRPPSPLALFCFPSFLRLLTDSHFLAPNLSITFISFSFLRLLLCRSCPLDLRTPEPFLKHPRCAMGR